MRVLKLYLFGAPRLEGNGDNVSVTRRKALAFLAYVTLRGQPQSREALATLFWPDFDQSRALSNLRRELSRIKSDVQTDLLEVSRQHVGPAADAALWVDVSEFLRHREQVAGHDHHFPAEPCAECQAALVQAVSLYTDRFMAGFSLPDAPEFDEWQFFQGESLSRAFGDSLQRLLQWHARTGNYDEAISYGRRLLALDTLHEPAHRGLMALYARTGQQAAALRQYEECVRLLDEELGVEPELETVALYQAIRTHQFPPAQREPPAALELPFDSSKRYVLEEPLASGGQGEVFLARDVVIGKQVIVKLLRTDLMDDQVRVARFLRERKALSQIDHPNIVRMLASFEQQGKHAIVMEYIPGGTLADLLAEKGPLSPEQVLSLAVELADALGRAHHLGILHRDLKPGNVLLTAAGEPRLSDFGTALLEGEEVRLTQTGLLVGSPAYMSPEALRGDTLDPRSDIWSFGVLLYELLTGRRPFPGKSITEILVRILTEPVPSLLAFRDDVPPSLVTLIEAMLAKERADRPASMRQVGAALEAIQSGDFSDGRTPAAPRPGRLQQEIRFCRAPDGVQIAYATVGKGPPLVKAANWLSHLEYDWESPVWHHWLRELAGRFQLVRYDERGCGLSDWDVGICRSQPGSATWRRW